MHQYKRSINQSLVSI